MIKLHHRTMQCSCVGSICIVVFILGFLLISHSSVKAVHSCSSALHGRVTLNEANKKTLQLCLRFGEKKCDYR